jgi:membrane protease subunit HflK
MPWSGQGGPWGGGQGPWGNRPRGGGQQPPDLEELLRRSQDKVKRLFPGGGGGSRRGVVLVALAVVALWLASGFYRVQPDEQGVVLRFGEWVKTTQPGLNYHLPWPIETAVTPSVTRVNRVEVGFRSGGDVVRSTATRNVSNESLMLTGDENIVDVNFVVFWVINDAGKYLFNIRNPEQTVKDAAESAMREVVGHTPIAVALSEGRRDVELATRDLLQQILDEYGAGIQVTQLRLQRVDPPEAVIDAFKDVQRARADQERLRNQAEAYRNDIIPRARGDAEQITQGAQAYREEVIARATGDAQRFTAVLEAYNTAKDVTRQRIYLETMEDVLSGMNKVLIDNANGGAGVVPYLPLPELQRRSREAPAPADAAQPDDGTDIAGGEATAVRSQQ